MTANFSPEELQQATGGRWLTPPPLGQTRGVYTDTRQPREAAVFVALRGENFDGHAYLEEAASQGAAAVMADENYAAAQPETAQMAVPVLVVEDTLRAFGDLAAYYRRRVAPRTVAITGSVGKTTIKDMTASVLATVFRVHSSRGNYNNLIGVPQEILSMREDTEVLIAECGADRPGEVQRLTEIVQPNAGVISHVFPCHLERFGTLEGIASEKGKLVAGLVEPDPVAVLNSQAAEREVLLSGCDAPVRYYGYGSESLLQARRERLCKDGTFSFLLVAEEEEIRVRLKVLGEHQVENALAAATVGYLLGVSLDDIARGLESCQGYWGRMKSTELKNGITLVEDVYNSNPGSMQAALDFMARFPRKTRIGVFGDMLDLGEESEHWHRVTGKQITSDFVDILVAVGPLAQGFAEGAASRSKPPGVIQHFENTPDALEWLLDKLEPGSLVLVKGSRGMKMETITEGLKNE